MRHLQILLSLFIITLSPGCGEAQVKPKPDIKLVFYNVENFFDWENDPQTNDEEFLPEGSRHWTKFRFEEKARNLFKVFAALGEADFPDIIGMTEVENAFVLDYLRTKTPMKKIPLSQVHRDSPDPRGIDACLLYRTDRLKLLHSEFIPIRDKKGKIQDTREIVYACFDVKGNSNLHVFVNHWPSRRGGELETQQKRNHVASILRKKIDSLLIVNSACNIVITGDFNDEPYNQSITKALKVREVNGEPLNSELYNLSSGFVRKYKTGTLKFRGNWSVFDQIIVSGALLKGRGLSTCSGCAGVFNKSFLLTEDKTHMGYMPWRTFNGMTYSGGFSDHLPVYLNLYFSKP